MFKKNKAFFLGGGDGRFVPWLCHGLVLPL